MKKLFNKPITKLRLYNLRKSNRQFLLETLTIFIVGIAGIGFGFTLNPNTHLSNIEQVHYIDGYRIELMDSGHPKMEGRYGYTNGSNDLYLEAGRKPVETYTTCVHEIKHNTHPDMDHPEHNWWFEQEERTFNEVCIQLMARMDVEKTFFDKYGTFVETVY